MRASQQSDSNVLSGLGDNSAISSSGGDFNLPSDHKCLDELNKAHQSLVMFSEYNAIAKTGAQKLKKAIIKINLLYQNSQNARISSGIGESNNSSPIAAHGINSSWLGLDQAEEMPAATKSLAPGGLWTPKSFPDNGPGGSRSVSSSGFEGSLSQEASQWSLLRSPITETWGSTALNQMGPLMPDGGMSYMHERSSRSNGALNALDSSSSMTVRTGNKHQEPFQWSEIYTPSLFTDGLQDGHGLLDRAMFEDPNEAVISEGL